MFTNDEIKKLVTDYLHKTLERKEQQRAGASLERLHNDRFTSFMDQYLPLWRHCRQELNRAPLGHDEWAE